MFVLVIGAWILPITGYGCAGGGGSGALDQDKLVGPGTVLSVEGDWSDVDASVHASAIRMEMTVLSAPPASRRGEPVLETREYRLRTVTDEPVGVVVHRTDAPAYELSVKIGRFGDPEREQELVGWISRRLRELGGVDVRRIDWAPG